MYSNVASKCIARAGLIRTPYPQAPWVKCKGLKRARRQAHQIHIGSGAISSTPFHCNSLDSEPTYPT